MQYIPQTLTNEQKAQARENIGVVDGISPTVTVSEITGGHNVAITDVNSTQSFDVLDGTKGENGFSPVVVVEAITGGHRITITDVNGTQSFDVLDGAAGSGGTVESGEWETPGTLYTGWQVHSEDEPLLIKRVGDMVSLTGRVSRASSGFPDNGTITVFSNVDAKYLPNTKRIMAVASEDGALELEVRPAESKILLANRTGSILTSGTWISLASSYLI